MTLLDPVTTAALILKVNSRHPAISHFRCSILQWACSTAGMGRNTEFKRERRLEWREWVMLNGKESYEMTILWKSWWCWSHEYDDRPGAGSGPWCDQSHPRSEDPGLVTWHRHQLSAIWLRYPESEPIRRQSCDQRRVSANQKTELWSEACIREDVVTRWNTLMARDTRSESHDRHIRTNTGPPLTRGGSRINDNNTSGNQICYMVHGNCVSNETAQEGNVCG